MDRLFFICGGVAGFFAAALAAFAAHGLKSRVTPEMVGFFETALRFQMYHALALFAAAWGWARWRHGAFAVAGVLFIIGIVAQLTRPQFLRRVGATEVTTEA